MDVVLELFLRKGHEPLRMFRPDPERGQARVDCYLQFRTLHEARAAQDLNEFMFPDDDPADEPWRVQLHQSCAFELQANLDKYWVADPSVHGSGVEMPAASVRDELPLWSPNFLDVYRNFQKQFMGWGVQARHCWADIPPFATPDASDADASTQDAV